MYQCVTKVKIRINLVLVSNGHHYTQANIDMKCLITKRNQTTNAKRGSGAFLTLYNRLVERLDVLGLMRRQNSLLDRNEF